MGKKCQVLDFVPYNWSHQVSDEGTTNRNGVGDITVILNYKVFDLASTGKRHRLVTHQLWLGGGVKLATGKFSIDPNDPAVDAAANTQIGSGSTDFLLNALFTIRIEKLGISTSASYKINTVNKDKYQFVNKFTANSFVFYHVKVDKTVITPECGAVV